MYQILSDFLSALLQENIHAWKDHPFTSLYWGKAEGAVHPGPWIHLEGLDNLQFLPASQCGEPAGTFLLRADVKLKLEVGLAIANDSAQDMLEEGMLCFLAALGQFDAGDKLRRDYQATKGIVKVEFHLDSLAPKNIVRETRVHHPCYILQAEVQGKFRILPEKRELLPEGISIEEVKLEVAQSEQKKVQKIPITYKFIGKDKK